MTTTSPHPTDQSPKPAGALADFLRRHPTPTARVALVADGESETTITVPAEALKLFIEILDHLEDGLAVSVVPSDTELTTQQAADLLGVSRPYLIDKVLEPTGSVPYRTVGRHRRIRFSDLEAFQKIDAQRRKDAANLVTQIALDAGMDD